VNSERYYSALRTNPHPPAAEERTLRMVVTRRGVKRDKFEGKLPEHELLSVRHRPYFVKIFKMKKGRASSRKKKKEGRRSQRTPGQLKKQPTVRTFMGEQRRNASPRGIFSTFCWGGVGGKKRGQRGECFEAWENESRLRRETRVGGKALSLLWGAQGQAVLVGLGTGEQLAKRVVAEGDVIEVLGEPGASVKRLDCI